jgi:carbamoyl-phosphate synthase large subunit
MPKRTDINRVMMIGSGPIVIGQACEFDYSGTQAVKALREEGYEAILVNSNPATIMTDPDLADRTYVEPLTAPYLERVMRRERPDALLPTLGGQTALNLAVELAERGVLEELGVETIGASPEVIRTAEDRDLFKDAARRAGLEIPRSGVAHSVDEALDIASEIGLPAVVRPSFTLGGAGGGVAYNRQELAEIAARGIDLSLVGSVLVEESVLGWKEYELEVMRDRADNVVIICSIENLDPMGVHTGDSITVAPAQTLTDREYQVLRDGSISLMRAIGVETGGSNIQFAVHPGTGRVVVIEMNPRVSRSSALASKATGFPIAKFAAKLAVGCTLDEIPNDITKKTPACFEPTIDYCVVKIPRFAFEKFAGADTTLTTSMKSVGEAMSIGRTFKEALQKGLRSLESDLAGLESSSLAETGEDDLRRLCRTPGPERLLHVRRAFERGLSTEELAELTAIDPWFLDNVREIVEAEGAIVEGARARGDGRRSLLLDAKRLGFSDSQLARVWGTAERAVRAERREGRLHPAYKLVDTCAAEFEAETPYFYSTYEEESECRATSREKVVILGSGPNRIGQGIEFDYCCVHAAFALRELGYETIMVNSNPETVSTDYDTSDRLYFEPLTLEDVLEIVHAERPLGVIVQFGGQTPLKLALPLEAEGVRVLGTQPGKIHLAEERGAFNALLRELGLKQPAGGAARALDEGVEFAGSLGYPVLVRPSYVLGGRAMAIVYSEGELAEFAREALAASPEHPILIDKFLEDAIEVDVDAVSDGERTLIGGVMEHVEEAGVHSGDSVCVLPPHTLSAALVDEIKRETRLLAGALDVRGLINVQYAVRRGEVFILEANPRASRTVPFVSKAIGVPLAKVATKVSMGLSLADAGLPAEVEPGHFAVKAPVFPFNRFPGVDAALGPEMKSTGEVMGIDTVLGNAMAKALVAAGMRLPTSGGVFVSVNDRDKRAIISIARQLAEAGLDIVSTAGTAAVLVRNGVEVETLPRISEGGRPNVLDLMKDGRVGMLVNTVSGPNPRRDEIRIRSEAIARGIPVISTVAGAQAAADGIASLGRSPPSVKGLQEYASEVALLR